MTERLTEAWYDDMEQFDRYAPKSPNIEINCGGDDFQRIIDKLAEYETAEEQGRLAVLLCKVGDTVYVIEDSHIEVFEVNKIEFKPKVFGNVTYYFEKPSRRGCLYKYYDSEFGVKWFTDREEAEKALKEMEEKKGE